MSLTFQLSLLIMSDSAQCCRLTSFYIWPFFTTHCFAYMHNVSGHKTTLFKQCSYFFGCFGKRTEVMLMVLDKCSSSVSWKVPHVHKMFPVRVGNCFEVTLAVIINVIITHQSPWPPLSLIGQTYLSLSSHCHPVRIGRPIQMSKTFLCLFLLLFMLTLPLHEVMIPLFFFSSPPTNGSCLSLYFFFFSILSHLPFSLFILLICLFSWRQQVGIDQGDIPDLSQVSVHLTFHFLLSLFLTPFSSCVPSPLVGFSSASPLSVLHCSLCALAHYFTPCFIPTYNCAPTLILSSSLSTHSFFLNFKQPSCLTWSQSRQLPSGLIDFLLCLSLLYYTVAIALTPALTVSSAQLLVSSRGTWDPEQMGKISPDLHASK